MIKSEKDINSIKKLLEIAGNENIIKDIYQNPFYNDEPKIYSFTSVIKKTTKLSSDSSLEVLAGGSSFTKERALFKTIGEAFERYSLSAYDVRNLIWDKYQNLKERAINPSNFISFSELRTKPKFKIYRSEKNKLHWTKGFSLTKKKDIFIPAQLVFVPYYFKKNEPVIRLPITTGAASHTSLEKAILAGLLEVIERDAFIINYLNKLSRKLIDIKKFKKEKFENITLLFKRYNLEFYIVDISTEVPVYSILSIIVDRSGLSPAISLGAKSSLDVENAIIGAIEENLHGRFWIRRVMVKTPEEKIKKIKENQFFISDLEERGLLWSTIDMVDKIKFFLTCKKIPIKSFPLIKTKNLNTLLNWFRKEDIEVIYIDVTPQNLRNKVYTIKVLIPQFQPLYLDERFSYQDGSRLKEIPKRLGFKPLGKAYRFPHPFL